MARSDPDDWRPCAAPEILRLRAALKSRARAFLSERGILEVDTPRITASAVTDPQIRCFAGVGSRTRFWLIPSPEFHLKRLLAAGLGDLYSFGPVFRDEEWGPLHEPEFTLLEYYRVGMDGETLAREVAGLLTCLIGPVGPVEPISFAELFERELGIDPITAPVQALWDRVDRDHRGGLPCDDRGLLWDFFLGHVLYPKLGWGDIAVIHDFPAEQAALARLRSDNHAVSERFEIVIRGLELANGYHELADPVEQARRFQDDRSMRRRLGRPDVEPDARYLAALEEGLPDCSGVAIGFDRIVLLASGVKSLAQVVAFPFARA
ncbi:Lysyl-tRNA synthetase-related protein [mine drainage metagenome]|uniref:Lysyl-tRNA synthetase-related protein n=2 Tax=mine drainage metagenome TaxID=410659 RepID=T0YR87_9ZZZZ